MYYRSTNFLETINNTFVRNYAEYGGACYLGTVYVNSENDVFIDNAQPFFLGDECSLGLKNSIIRYDNVTVSSLIKIEAYCKHCEKCIAY